MADVKKFYSSDIGVDTLVNKKYDDGSELFVVMYNKPTKGIQIHFWQGAKAEKEGAGEFAVKDWEDYMHSVHKKIITSDVCGFD